MPRENSFSDSDGRSLTPDLDEEMDAPPASPHAVQHPHFKTNGHHDATSLKSGRSKRSLRAILLTHSPSMAPDSHANTQHPRLRFRALVQKVISMHRGTLLLNNRTVGAEPGIDPSRPAVDAVYKHIEEACEIEVTDYSAVRSNYRRLNNKEFVDLMGADAKQREPWVKVRWINIGGISWDVIKAVSIKYGLHPLALEEVFHGHSQNRSKADYYPKHLFLHVVCHELASNSDAASKATGQITNAPRSNSPEPIADFDSVKKSGFESGDASKNGSVSKRKSFSAKSLLPVTQVDVKPVNEDRNSAESPHRYFTALSAKQIVNQNQRTEHKEDVAIVEALKHGSSVDVDVTPMFFFLLRDGTIISIRPTPNLSFTAPISYRLKSRDTVIRKSADASLLLHSLLDLIVDKAVQVIDQYNIKIRKYERDILLSLQMSTVRELHILSGDLILHKRTLEPVKTLIYGLRRYDGDRAAALVDVTDPGYNSSQAMGFMSAKSKIYLADVYDHMDYILTSLDMYASIAENLIAYSFNTKSYEMNNVMRRLTITTIICLPLTLLSGYFGMNFDTFWSVQHGHSDVFFWELAIPILSVVVVIALWGDLKEFWKYLLRKKEIKHAVQ